MPILSTLIVVTIVLGLQLAGVILMVGMLIAPGIAARQWTHIARADGHPGCCHFGRVSPAALGAVISALDSDIPTGPMIIVVAFAWSFCRSCWRRGAAWFGAGCVNARIAAAFAARNTLRDLYRYAQAHGAPDAAVPDAFIRGVRGSAAESGLRQLRQAGHVSAGRNEWRLTESGIALARHDRRNLRLWDAYRLYADELGLPLVPEDRQRDIA